MKKVTLIFVLVLAAVVVGTVYAGSSMKATGSGHYTLGTSQRTFAFNAMIEKDGRISGQVQVVRHDFGTHVHAVVDCLSFDNNIATMSGVVTSTNHDPIEPGDPIWFKVVDNGEGRKATAADQFTKLYLSGERCDDEPDFVLSQNVEHGNIQVK